MAQLDFPYAIDHRGRSAAADEAGHLRDLIEQLLFTAPGERVMRPDFVCGLAQLVFEPNSVTLAATTQMLVQASLLQHLSHLIAVDEVSVQADGAALRVHVAYTVLADGQAQRASFAVPGGSA